MDLEDSYVQIIDVMDVRDQTVKEGVGLKYYASLGLNVKLGFHIIARIAWIAVIFVIVQKKFNSANAAIIWRP